MSEDDEDEIPEEVELPIDGVLDLHHFSPRDVEELVKDYVEACRDKGIFEVRIIHGKGTGFQKRVVEKVLSRHPLVASFRPADERAGGWGATLAVLKR